MKSKSALILGCVFFASAVHAEMVKETVVDKIEVLSSGCVQVRESMQVADNGKIISQQFHRYVVVPGDDYSKRDAKVKAICNKIHTPEKIAEYKALIDPNAVKPEPTLGLVKRERDAKIHVLEDGRIVVEKRTEVLEDGKLLGSTRVIEQINPGDDYADKDQTIKDIADIVQTKAVVDTYKAKIDAEKGDISK